MFGKLFPFYSFLIFLPNFDKKINSTNSFDAISTRCHIQRKHFRCNVLECSRGNYQSVICYVLESYCSLRASINPTNQMSWKQWSVLWLWALHTQRYQNQNCLLVWWHVRMTIIPQESHVGKVTAFNRLVTLQRSYHRDHKYTREELSHRGHGLRTDNFILVKLNNKNLPHMVKMQSVHNLNCTLNG